MHTHPKGGGGHEYGQAWSIAAALLDGPKSFAELLEHYRVMARRFGVFVDLWDRGAATGGEAAGESPVLRNLRASLDLVLEHGWAEEREGRYYITDSGREQAERMLSELERSGRFLERATAPVAVSTVTLVVHFLLGSIKLPAALVSGSVGLLNDALDTLMDGVSSLFVFLGVRSGRERLVSYLLVGFMGATGLFSLYEALRRFVRAEPLSVDPLAVGAVIASGVICAGLWLYQKYCGLKHGSVPLIAQSVDSRNHVIVAAGVGAGLFAAAFDLALLDRLVGLAVAVLILKGAVELLVDLVKSAGEEEVDLSRWGFSRLESHRRRQMVRWFLYEIDRGRISSREEMMQEARAATEFSKIPTFRALGIHEQPDREEKLTQAVSDVFRKGLASEAETVAGGRGSGAGGSADRGGRNHGAGDSQATGVPPRRLVLTCAGQAELEKAISGRPVMLAGRPPSGPRGVALRAFAFALRFVVSAVLFAAAYLVGRWVLGWLPDLDVWAADAFLVPGAHVAGARGGPAGAAFSISVRGLRGTEVLTATQVACVAVGLGLFHAGRGLSHRARHLLHHATEHRGERPLFLATTGVYAGRRHPHAAGLVLTNLGLALGLHSVYVLVLAAIAIAAQLIGARVEERQLSAQFGEKWTDYVASVDRRFFSPVVWVLFVVVYLGAWIGIV